MRSKLKEEEWMKSNGRLESNGEIKREKRGGNVTGSEE